MTTAAGSGDRSSPDRATSGQRLVNCLLRVSSSKAAAGEDEIVSGHAIDHELALLARVEGQVFEDFNHPADLHAFGQKTRERCASLGDGFVGTCDHLEFTPVKSPDQASTLPRPPIGLIPSMRLVSRRRDRRR